MAHTCSTDLRERCLEAINRGESVKDIACWAGVSTRAIHYWKKRKREEGHVNPRPGFHRGRKSKVDARLLEAHVNQFPDMALEERGCYFGVSRMAISRSLKKIGYTRKKSVSLS